MNELKMGKTLIIIIVLIILIIIGGSVGYFYFKGYQPKAEVQIIKLYIEAKDIVTNEPLKASFTVVSNDTIIYAGETTEKGMEEVKVEKVQGKNLYVLANTPEHYVSREVYAGGPIRFELYPFGDISIKEIAKNSTTAILNISTDYQYREMFFCYKYSTSFIDVWSNEFIKINNPQRFSDWDDCYHTKVSLDIDQQQSIVIILNYNTWREFNDFDQLEIVFTDSDRNFLNEYIVEAESGEYVGSKDIEYTIKFVE